MAQIIEDDADWATRNEHWLAISNQRRGYSPKGARRREPLILCGHGVSLKIDKGTLLIRDGFTHWPQERTEHRFFKGSPQLPPRIVMLDGSGCLTFDVMAWLSEQSIPLIHLDYRGNVVSVIGGAGFATDPDKVRWQTETRNDPERRLAFCCELIAEKLTKSLRTLTEEIPDSPARKVAIARTEVEIHRLRKGQFRSVDEVRLSEALAAAAYFKAWQGIPLAWRNRARCPVPDDWLTTQKRNTIASGGWRSNRNAKHPVNAILNYAYAMVSSQAHVDALANGYDPRRGIMHHDRDDGDALAFVFDLIEPRRPLVDAAVLRFVRRTPLSGADFAVRSDGVCRLAPQLAKVVSQQACEVVSGSLRVARDH